MNPFLRWCRFNLVGAVGMVLQLAALACFERWFHGHYLIATAAAVELTLVHNFVGHLHFTWRDRRTAGAIPGQFLRFHLSNGLVSMLGNLALMPLLVRGARLPLLAANAVAVLCCSLANFCLSHLWGFASRQPASPRAQSTSGQENLQPSL
jgi:putative flippase GtrA